MREQTIGDEMERVRLTDMAQAMNAHAEVPDSIEVGGVSTDSRTLRAGELFFAIVGESFDGHAFVDGALEAGACGAVVSDAGAGSHTAGAVPVLVVDDTIAALQDASAWYRRRFELPVVGVTGTNGKTTTKDMAAAVLATRFATARTSGNYNNHIGVPLTLFDLTSEHEVAVVEMGMNHPGEIARLAEISRPSVGVITNVAEGHLETMNDLDTVANAKAELLDALPPGGTSVLNWDDKRVKGMWARGPSNVITFGFSADAEVRAVEVTEEADGVRFELAEGGSVSLPVPGRHNVTNALAAIAVGRTMGVSDEDAARGLAGFEPSPMRMSMTRAGKWSVLNDAYNSNPGSLRAALAALVSAAGGRTTAAALGDMLELGAVSESAHRASGVMAAELGIDMLFLFGREVEALREGAIEGGIPPSSVHVYENKTALVDALRSELPESAVLLVKGSRGMRMEEVVELLTAEAPASKSAGA